MPITTQAQEYTRLRSFLNPYIAGPNVDAVLNALAVGNAAYLVNNVAAVNAQLYIVTASDQYLDARLAEAGITRPSAVGLSDEIFREIGIAVKNRKQVRDLMNDLLDYIFGDQFVKASNSSTMIEPYALADGDTLTINFDELNTVTITFSAAQFENIGAALAQEVADAIVTDLSNLGYTGTAVVQNNGLGNYVQIFSSTIGPRSSVTIEGGSAQNVLVFPSVVAAGGNASTQWTVSFGNGGVIRFTWTGGANPNLGELQTGNYVNIYGGGFASSANQGTYTITNSVGGPVDVSYFEVSNPLGVPGVFTQGSNTAILFYNPTKESLTSNPQYAAIYQTQSRVLQVFLPATTQVIRRSRIGSAHIHYPPQGTFQLLQLPLAGDIFVVDTTLSLIAGTDFVIGSSIPETVANIVAEINSLNVGLLAVSNTTTVTNDTVNILNNSTSNTLVISYDGYSTGTFTFTGNSTPGDQFDINGNIFTASPTSGSGLVMIGLTSEDTATNLAAVISTISEISAVAVGNVVTVTASPLLGTIPFSYSGTPVVTTSGSFLAPNPYVLASGPEGDNTSLIPNQQGPYSYDLAQPFTVSAINTTLTETLNANSSRVIEVANSSQFPNTLGYLILGYGTEEQEGPVPYIVAPSSTTLLISPIYTIQNVHPAGTSVMYVAQNSPVVLTQDGLDYPFYVTDVVSGREYAQSLINSVAATGINIVFTILYPGDIGLGKWGTPYSEISQIYGP
jgi:hypothetical protein